MCLLTSNCPERSVGRCLLTGVDECCGDWRSSSRANVHLKVLCNAGDHRETDESPLYVMPPCSRGVGTQHKRQTKTEVPKEQGIFNVTNGAYKQTNTNTILNGSNYLNKSLPSPLVSLSSTPPKTGEKQKQ